MDNTQKAIIRTIDDKLCLIEQGPDANLILALFTYMNTRSVSKEMKAYAMARCYNKLDVCIKILHDIIKNGDYCEDETEEDVKEELKLALELKEKLKEFNFLADNY